MRKLTSERIEELKNLVKNGREICADIKSKIIRIESGPEDESLLQEINNDIIREEEAKKIAKIEEEEWLAQREIKLAKIKQARPGVQAASTKTLKIPTAISIISEDNPLDAESLPTETLKVDVGPQESNATSTQLPDSKISSSTPSMSPLLTSLLRNSLPSSPFQAKETSQQLSPTFQPQSLFNASSLTDDEARQSFASTNIISSSENPSVSQPNTTINVDEKLKSPLKAVPSPVPQQHSSSPTLSKLLELPPSDPGKLPPLPIIVEDAVKEPVQTQKPGEQIIKESEDNQIEHNKLSEELRNTDSIEGNIESENISTANGSEETSNTSNSEESVIPTKDIKKELIESKETSEENSIEDLTVKQESTTEPVETDIPTNPTEIKTPILTDILRNKRRRPVTPSSASTPATRRSGRVRAIRELKGPDGTESESSVQADSNMMSKKSSSIDETTDASLSEESMDAIKNVIKVPSITESVPNSPSSSTMHSEDAETIREYKTWKKSIMLLWYISFNGIHSINFIFQYLFLGDKLQHINFLHYFFIPLQMMKQQVIQQLFIGL